MEIKKWSDKEARDAYNRFIQKPLQDYTKIPPGPDEKILRDYFVVMTLLKCRENDLPMQFHTGMGGAPTLDLRKANPILMQDILAVDEIKETKVVLTHAGFPYCEETAMMTSVTIITRLCRLPISAFISLAYKLTRKTPIIFESGRIGIAT